MTNNYLFADTCVEITHTFPYFSDLAKDYLGGEVPEFSIAITPEDIAQERENGEVKTDNQGYLESLAIYRKLCDNLVMKNIILIHSAAIAVDGKAYLFTAPSGTGKTTHIRLWKKKFGDKAIVVNGDKPLVSVTADEIRVWGTPWDGKEHWSTNISAPIAGICQIGRGEENEICPVSAGDALARLYSQTYHPTTEAGMRKTVQLLLQIAQRVPFWRLKCNMSTEAAEVSYAAMKGE